MMTLVYCTALDLVSHANKARLLSHLASNDYSKVPTAEAVMMYLKDGISTAEELNLLEQIKARMEQAIEQSASEINGYLAVMPTLTANIPTTTLSTINVDLAMARLFDNLSDDSTVKMQADRWLSWFDKLATGKIGNTVTTTTNDTVVIGSAEVAGSDLLWTTETLSGY